MTEIPEGIEKEGIFKHLFEEAKYYNLNKKDQEQYEADLKVYRDIVNVIDTAKIEGKIEGKLEGKEEEKIEIAKNMLKDNMEIKLIAKFTELSESRILEIKGDLH